MAVSASARGTAAGSVPLRLAPESRLARLATEGDTRAFEAIFERYHQELYRYCRAILSNPDEAQDALQNTMAAALRSLPGEDRELKLRPWLYRVAHNEAISIARRRAESPLVLDGDAGIAPSAQLAVEDRERLEALVTDLKALPDRQRSALVMRELSGLGYDEIAAAVGASEGAARQIVYEAREAMRESRQGRLADCQEVRMAISDRDGRVLRGRRIRAHLRGCEGCRDFRTGISQRRSDLQMLAPPMPALAASGVLGALLGEAGGKGAAAGLGTATASGSGASVAGAGGVLAGSS